MSVDARRLNIGERLVIIRVTNETQSPVAISAAQLATPLFQGTPMWTPGPSGSSILRPGTTVALPAPLTQARCAPAADTDDTPASPSPPASPQTPHASPPTAFLTLDGSEREFAATDPHAVLTAFHQQDCLEQSVLEVAALALPRELDVAPDGRTAVVRLAVLPTGAGGDLTLSSIGATTLLAEDADRPWPRNVAVSGSDPPSVLEVSVRPARCDAHALAEDKAGTRLPVEVTVGKRSGELRLEPAAEFTRAVYAFVADACARMGPTEAAAGRG